MGQYEILICLEKYDKPVSRRQICDDTGYEGSKVSHLLNKLLRAKEVRCIEYDRKQAGKALGMAGAFRRMRFYYV